MDMIKLQTGRSGEMSGAALKKSYPSMRGKNTTGEMKIAFQDTLTIQSEKTNSLSDEQFLSAATKRMAAEVREGASDYKLQDLQRQVAFGEYDIGVNEMIRKIMFTGDA